MNDLFKLDMMHATLASQAEEREQRVSSVDPREARESKVITEYRIETIRHAANVIFNKLNEAQSFAGTDQGKQALSDAQTCADIIVGSPNSAAMIVATPTPAQRGSDSPRTISPSVVFAPGSDCLVDLSASLVIPTSSVFARK